MTSTQEVLQLIATERQRQQDKWGEQNHPNIDVDDVQLFRETVARFPALPVPESFIEHVASRHNIPTANQARDTLQQLAAAGKATWGRILLEEFAEAIEAAALAAIDKGPIENLRTELIQVAAVAVQWAEKLGGTE
ncbi:hypothetical protein [Mycobacteroides abscessus]|uniref:Uncharacterized protein n=1 Tax=Mycobacteroides abscessus 1948 TaxID=1299323 RepID=A0A829QRV7_9MYCO|nr:hypothetical protein [Mycobacteroides abscessus]EUA64969.1 hypothetical protein I542_5147 [Mycobacteroides abscessus 1948]EIU48432.1 hypothetical protein MA6G0125S_1063 [Mycobacteroides abscessus 6G-0125-S]EIU50817.1 hypothetical protein MA6G0125R_0093 [Mycobacteroides abscessus 6G-0125-R]EIU56363.1 hypothetical protein MA6G0728S_1389 [Mycobacteroides abscessus 6G-0728-S]EIU66120.1 hypothetical protein MA6G1108_1048 [Mycobacteroides abscessus 6G-1108]